eukprot:1670153-Amphidinium_carterae.1
MSHYMPRVNGPLVAGMLKTLNLNSSQHLHSFARMYIDDKFSGYCKEPRLCPVDERATLELHNAGTAFSKRTGVFQGSLHFRSWVLIRIQ